MRTRQSAFAGSWYPDTAAGCEKEIAKFMADPGMTLPSGSGRIGGIVPHAGWYFSGSLACNVIRSLGDDGMPDVLAIFGMHLHPDSPCHIMVAGAWETPVGTLHIDTAIAEALNRRFEFRIETVDRYTPENTIELQLPFIKYFFPDATIVPIGVPPRESSLEIGSAVAEISRQLGKKMAVIGSTDLTHYGANYGFSPKGSGSDAVSWVRDENDRRVIEAMTEMDAERVIAEARKHHNACCAGAAAAAIAAAKGLGASRAHTVAYASSHDKSPGRSFVGYVGIVFETS